MLHMRNIPLECNCTNKLSSRLVSTTSSVSHSASSRISPAENNVDGAADVPGSWLAGPRSSCLSVSSHRLPSLKWSAQVSCVNSMSSTRTFRSLSLKSKSPQTAGARAWGFFLGTSSMRFSRATSEPATSGAPERRKGSWAQGRPSALETAPKHEKTA